MIERYTLPEMGRHLDLKGPKMQAWPDVEIAAVKAGHHPLARSPAEAVGRDSGQGRLQCCPCGPRSKRPTNHDVIAFLTNVAENVGDASKYVHYGMTSSDMLDTGSGAADQARRPSPSERDLAHPAPVPRPEVDSSAQPRPNLLSEIGRKTWSASHRSDTCTQDSPHSGHS